MHLLVVEDDQRLGRSLKRLLEGDRHLVELVATGDAALEVAESDGIELVILDIGLPDISGIEVAHRLRDEGSKLPILMLTARDAIPDRVAGLNAGADDYLVKPFAYEELVARLRALDRRSHTTMGRRGAVLANGPLRLDEEKRLVDGRRDKRWTCRRASSACSNACSAIPGRSSRATSSSSRRGRRRLPHAEHGRHVCATTCATSSALMRRRASRPCAASATAWRPRRTDGPAALEHQR